MWNGVEPQRQEYNITYLNVMKQIVELLESNKIFVILDMHQDGIPLWLYDQFPSSNHSCK